MADLLWWQNEEMALRLQTFPNCLFSHVLLSVGEFKGAEETLDKQFMGLMDPPTIARLPLVTPALAKGKS